MQIFLSHLATYHNAIIVGLALAAACSLLSVFIVLRRMALIAEAVAHSGIGGIGVAFLIAYYVPAMNHPIAVQIITGIFCITTALLIGYITKGKHVSEDSAIGIFLVATLALGILLIEIRSKLPFIPGQIRAASVEQVLFGDIISVTPYEAWLAVGTMVAIYVIILALYNEFVYTTLDEEMARINGVNTRLINFLMLSMISLIIVVGARMAGALMITAFTILPGATANMLSRKFNGVLIASLLIGLCGVGGALMAAINPPLWEFTSGPVLVLALFLVFVVTWLARRLMKPRVSADASAVQPHEHAH